MNRTLLAMTIMHFGLTGIVGLQAQQPAAPEPAPLPSEIHGRCLDTLSGALKSDEFWPSMHAAEALTVAGKSSQVRAALHDRLSAERDDQRRCGLARELVRAGEREPLAILFEILENTESTGRVHAAESLYKLGEAGHGRQLLAAMSQVENLQLRLMAAAALASAGHADALKLLGEQLRSGDRPVRNTAAFALARLGGPGDVQPLLSALKNETDAAARTFLCGALACLGDAHGRAELGKNLDAQDPAVRALAADFVGQSRSTEYQKKLVQLLDDPSLDVRVRAAGSLIVLSLPEARR